MRNPNPKIMITQDLNCEDPGNFYPNANPDCVYYVNQRLMVLPGYGYASEDHVENSPRLTVNVAEFIECLPGVYTRVLKTEIEFDNDMFAYRSNADYDLTESTRALFDKDPYGKFCGMAFYLNSLNNYVQTSHDGKPRTYSRLSPLDRSATPPHPDEITSVEEDWDALGRTIKVTSTWESKKTIGDFRWLNAVKFEVVGGEEVAK